MNTATNEVDNRRNGSEEHVIAVVGLRWLGGVLQQCLRVGDSLGVVTDRWEHVPGHAVIGYNTKWARFDWSTVDWSMNDMQIAAAIKSNQGTVRRWRYKLGKPPVLKETTKTRPLTLERVEQADWRLCNDAHLARQWGVSRERVRQLRMMYKKPACITGGITHGSDAYYALKWLLENRESLANRSMHEIIRMMPAGDLSIPSRRLLMKRSGVQCVFTRSYVKDTIIPQMNMDLPSILLNMIWDASSNYTANNRCRRMMPKPRWKAIAKNHKFISDPEFRKAMDAEIMKAATFNRKSRRKEIATFLRNARIMRRKELEL